MNKSEVVFENFKVIQNDIDKYREKIPEKVSSWNYNEYLNREKELASFIDRLVSLREEIETSTEISDDDKIIHFGNINREIMAIETKLKINSHKLIKFSIHFSIAISIVSLLIALVSLAISIIGLQ